MTRSIKKHKSTLYPARIKDWPADDRPREKLLKQLDIRLILHCIKLSRARVAYDENAARFHQWDILKEAVGIREGEISD